MDIADVDLPLVVEVKVGVSEAIDLTAYVLIEHSTLVLSIPSNSETIGWEQVASTDAVGPNGTETTGWK